MIKKKFTLLILLHSSHRCCKPLNISIPTCNVLVFLMSLMSLAHKSDISDMAFLLVITRGGIVNQSVVVSVQSVQWDGELENIFYSKRNGKTPRRF